MIYLDINVKPFPSTRKDKGYYIFIDRMKEGFANTKYTQNNESLAYMIGWINKQYSYILKEFNEENEDKRDK